MHELDRNPSIDRINRGTVWGPRLSPRHISGIRLSLLTGLCQSLTCLKIIGNTCPTDDCCVGYTRLQSAGPRTQASLSLNRRRVGVVAPPKLQHNPTRLVNPSGNFLSAGFGLQVVGTPLFDSYQLPYVSTRISTMHFFSVPIAAQPSGEFAFPSHYNKMRSPGLYFRCLSPLAFCFPQFRHGFLW